MMILEADDTGNILDMSSIGRAHPRTIKRMKQAAANQSDEVPLILREAVIEVMRAADVARREMMRSLKPFGVTLQQANVLIILRRANGEGVPTLEVARRLIEQAPGVTRFLSALISKGYVRREHQAHDRRHQLCFLTAKGTRLTDRLLPAVRSSHARTMKRVVPQDLNQLVRILKAIEDEA
jgi:DNA-binding MarR family transcriptional regulator